MTGLLRVYAASGALTLFICFHLKPEYGIGLYVLSLFKLTGVILYFVLNSIRNLKTNKLDLSRYMQRYLLMHFLIYLSFLRIYNAR